MNIQYIEKESIMNGEGNRCVVWCSGCSHHCPGCHNPETWDPESGVEFTDEHLKELFTILENPYIAGVTFSGGDPFHEKNRAIVLRLCKTLKHEFPDKDIWLYTGYNWEDIKDWEDLKFIDVIVEGPFIMKLLDVKYPWAGSTNQRVIRVEESLLQHKIVLWGEKNGKTQ